MAIPQSAEERFWSRVDKTSHPGGCWLWSAGKDSRGYGKLYVAGKVVRTHRFSYELNVGVIMDGLFVCHTCDIRLCVNPAHLFLGTNSENVADMVSKGRQSRGEKHPVSRYKEYEIVEMREKHRSGVSIQQLARNYGMNPGTMYRILRGFRWKHVPI
jgi:hypothetical protein